MSEIRTEEEQLQAIRQWWKENGKSLMLGIGGALAITLGWQAWQNNQAATAEAASISYANYVDAASKFIDDGEPELLSTANHLASELKENFDSSVYAQYTALIQAKLFTESGEFDAAEAELEWVLEQEPTDRVATVTKLRLAKVKIAKGQADAALTGLSGLLSQGFDALVYEMQGDAFLQLGKKVEAAEAYANALEQAPISAGQSLLTLKLDDLAVEEG